MYSVLATAEEVEEETPETGMHLFSTYLTRHAPVEKKKRKKKKQGRAVDTDTKRQRQHVPSVVSFAILELSRLMPFRAMGRALHFNL